jgi:hypothetical protein
VEISNAICTIFLGFTFFCSDYEDYLNYLTFGSGEGDDCGVFGGEKGVRALLGACVSD